MENEPAPEWLNAEFLIRVLDKEVNGGYIIINKFEIQPAVPKGEHFASSLHRVVVDFTFLDGTKSVVKKTNYLIIKSLPVGEIIRKMVIDAGTFKRETKIYESILPEIYKLQQEKFGPNARHFTSNCLFTEQDVIVMNDLCQKGYQMANRRKGLDMAHCRVALKYLARFHGLSAAIFYQNRESMADLSEGFYKEERRPILEAYFKPGIKCLASAVEKSAGYQRFGEKLVKVAETAVDRMINVVKPSSNSLSVLNHGDFWVNNILFRYSDNEETKEILDVMFVDFQISRFSSPCLDLQFFMCTSPTEEVRYEYMDELLGMYHQELRETLSVVGHDQIEFSLQQLKKEFDDKGIYGLIIASMLLQLVLSDPNEATDMDHVKEEDMRVIEGNALEKGFENSLFRDQFQKLLLYYEKKGVI